jgi:hypothetical protein
LLDDAMNEQFFTTWVNRLGRAWETGDPEAAAALFGPTATYSENPFDPPLVGREAIRAYWAETAGDHEQVRCVFSVIGVFGATGVAHWRTTLVRRGSGQAAMLAGVIVTTFDEDGACVSLREWWQAQEAREV